MRSPWLSGNSESCPEEGGTPGSPKQTKNHSTSQMPASLADPQGRAQGFWVTPGFIATGASETEKNRPLRYKNSVGG